MKVALRRGLFCIVVISRANRVHAAKTIRKTSGGRLVSNVEDEFPKASEQNIPPS